MFNKISGHFLLSFPAPFSRSSIYFHVCVQLDLDKNWNFVFVLNGKYLICQVAIWIFWGDPCIITIVNLGVNTKREQLPWRCGWLLMCCSGLIVNMIRVVHQTRCFCRQRHNHHRNIPDLRAGWRPAQSSCLTEVCAHHPALVLCRCLHVVCITRDIRSLLLFSDACKITGTKFRFQNCSLTRYLSQYWRRACTYQIKRCILLLLRQLTPTGSKGNDQPHTCRFSKFVVISVLSIFAGWNWNRIQMRFDCVRLEFYTYKSDDAGGDEGFCWYCSV